MMIGNLEEIHLVRLYKSYNGGTIGDGWGEFVTPPADFKTKKYFKTGEWMYFSADYATKVDDFVKGNDYILFCK